MHASLDVGLENLHKYMNLQEDDIVLYLGGRIDDDNLYPAGYASYLNEKIKKLAPNKIICHTHWYAGKYYDKKILDESTKIDVITAYRDHFQRGPRETINVVDYINHKKTLKKITTLNPNLIYAIYICHPTHAAYRTVPGKFDISDEIQERFGSGYDFNNIKYFYFSRRYCPNNLINWDMNVFSGEQKIKEWKGLNVNATDGFAIINSFLNAGFKNLNILGFTAFGSEEDMSNFTEYNCKNETGPDTRFNGLKYFDIKTSENQRHEADILQDYVASKKINNLEDYDKLLFYLKEKL
tara:strand:- start:1857 stop:2744 length:888 start_codon:yes stop_codon:yes gene_type:complete